MEQNINGLKLVDAGFDYLTFTSSPKREEYEQFQQVALAFIEGLESAGLEVKETRSGGYDGYQCGETFYGRRGDGAIWRTSGRATRAVAQFAKAHELTPNVTRADLQQTIEQPGGDTGELGRIFAASQFRCVGGKTAECKKHAAFYVEGVLTGGTLGARSSTSYLRCYRADIRHPETFKTPAVRYEAEWKGERANQIWGAFSGVDDDVTLSCRYVGGAFAAKRIMQPVCADYSPQPLPPIGRKGSDEKTVFWVQETVCKIIARLVKAGYRDELAPHILAALNPSPDVVKRSTSLGMDIAEIDWELFTNESNHQN